MADTTTFNNSTGGPFELEGREETLVRATNDIPASIRPILTAAQVDRLRPFGVEDQADTEAVIIREGQRPVDFLVVLSGRLEARHSNADGTFTSLADHGAGGILGEIATMSGQASLVFVSALEPSRFIRITPDNLRRVLVEDSEISDIILSTFMARRERMRERNLTAIQLFGSSLDNNTHRVREFLTRNNIPHAYTDVQKCEDTAEFITGACRIPIAEMPLLKLRSGELLRNPSAQDIARKFGLDHINEGELWDLVVVGAGPAGLASAVYAASEGLKVTVIDGTAPGGQASTSSKIENYLGFPTGITGRDLADRAAAQAQKFGVQIATPVGAKSLDCSQEAYVITTSDDRQIMTRSLVVASGAMYRKLPVADLMAYEGQGIFYAATGMEAQLCEGAEVTLVGGGNSAGQAAVFLASVAKHVHIHVRKPDLTSSMSAYLIRRIEEAPNITVHGNSAIVGLHGKDRSSSEDPDRQGSSRRLEGIDIHYADRNETEYRACRHLFTFIGAEACTDWLSGCVALDDRGFVKTGGDVTPMEMVRSTWALDRVPTLYETSRPRIYAVGDVRSGSVKRVASAVGEGSVVIQFVHRALAE
ncbi:MAG: FAD-dependent oxidoreductase [Pseudomonadota bacterium]